MIRYFGQLLKFKLSVTVVFSAMIGYLLGFDQFNLHHFICLTLGGILVTGSANTFNQILERDEDKLMERTSSRPLPQGNLTFLQAFIFASIIGLLGLFLLNKINPQGMFYGVMSKSSFFGLISILLYVLSYTPLKRVSTISIFVGAIPGAIPFLLGYVAATDNFDLAAGTLFAIQFFWQFPHFIAIAWVQHEDYKRAGFKMMIGGEKGVFAAAVSIVTSVLLMIVSVSPFFWKVPNLSVSIVGLVICLMFNFVFIFKSINLLIKQNDSSAKKLMIYSFIYLPMIQLLLIIDKYFIII